jgi:cell division protein FtsW
MNTKKFDQPLMIAIVLLALFGMIMMSSVSVGPSFIKYGNNDYFFWRHLVYLLLGFGGFFVGLVFPYKSLRNFSGVIYLVCVVLLFYTALFGDKNGTFARSWINFAGISIQPVEIAKLGIIIFLATLFSNGRNRAHTIEGGLIPFLLVLLLPAGLIIAQPDFGSLIVFLLASASVYFVAGANWKHIATGVSAASVAAIVAYLSFEYIQKRIAIFLDPGLDPTDSGYQVLQVLIAIGSGGSFGRGFQNSAQKFNLPEVQSDTVFAAIAEEMGFFRILIFVGLYLFIAFRGYKVALNVSDEFSRYLAVGLTTWFVGQAFINIAVNLTLFPNTGITLPLISYGGSSLVLTLVSLGILVQISGNEDIVRRKKANFFG